MRPTSVEPRHTCDRWRSCGMRGPDRRCRSTARLRMRAIRGSGGTDSGSRPRRSGNRCGCPGSLSRCILKIRRARSRFRGMCLAGSFLGQSCVHRAFVSGPAAFVARVAHRGRARTARLGHLPRSGDRTVGNGPALKLGAQVAWAGWNAVAFAATFTLP